MVLVVQVFINKIEIDHTTISVELKIIEEKSKCLKQNLSEIFIDGVIRI